MSAVENEPLRLIGRDFAGFRNATCAQAKKWTSGSVSTAWCELAELEQLTLHTSACTDGSIDLVLVPADWLPALAARDAIIPVGGGANWMDWPAGWSASFVDGVTFDGEVWGLPYHDGPQLLFWRTDLYSDEAEVAGYSEAFGRDLKPPATWQEFDTQARWFTRTEDHRYGTVLAGAPDGHNNVYDFVVQLWARKGRLLDDRGRAAFADPAGVAAAEWLRETAANVVSPAARTMDSVASGEEFASGRVALMVNWAGFAAMATAEDAPARGNFSCALAPFSAHGEPTPTVNAFWAIAVAAGSRHKKRTADFLRHLATAEMDLLTTLNGACGTRLSSWRDTEALARYPEQALFERAHRNSRPLPRVARLPDIVGILNAALERIVHCAQPAPATLADAARAVDALDAPAAVTPHEATIG